MLHQYKAVFHLILYIIWLFELFHNNLICDFSPLFILALKNNIHVFHQSIIVELYGGEKN